ncbi:methyl-accepting chemotaxis protein [Motiliproteus coralliicola]|uniref:Methyl-accepting chemotaxis protein n=1 Tax=Motiliproteus coralliicola TaxID=2283196 RepID=A0A369WGI8_9GAMM|nr:methyl-accepting chemotaxis protein [Motiliproteus coralliicola]RDE19726.1 methyl-accepting chemotaxis protein [Motiliproteus coralliicola]
MTIKRILQLTILSIAVSLIITALLVMQLLNNQVALYDASERQQESTSFILHNMASNDLLIRSLREYAYTANPQALDEYNQRAAMFTGEAPWPTGKTLAEADYIRQLGFGEIGDRVLAKIETIAAPVWDAEEQALALMEQAGDDPARRQQAMQLLHSADYIKYARLQSEPLEELGQHIFSTNKQNMEGLFEDSQSYVTAIVGFVLLSLLLLLAAFFYLQFKVIRPIGEVVDLTEQVAEGDFRVRSDLKGSNEMGRFGLSMNAMLQKINLLIANIGDSGSRINQVSDELTRMVAGAKLQADQQQLDVEQVATAATQMSHTTQEVATNCADAAAAARDTASTTSDGQRVVEETIHTINQLSTRLNDSSDSIQQLETHTERVANVVNVIQGIAEQTNLLALNAAIEAARAGEQGRGFAVVADEVRTLAQRTHSSTEEIKTTIEQLISGTHRAVSLMEESNHVVGDVVVKADSAGAALEAIFASVNVIQDMNNQIATATEEQTSVVDEISGILEKIREFSRGSLQDAERAESAADNLRQVVQGQTQMLQGLKT